MATLDDILFTAILLKTNLASVYADLMPLYARSQAWQFTGGALPSEGETKEVYNRYRALKIPKLTAETSLRAIQTSEAIFTGTLPTIPPECQGAGGGLIIPSDTGLTIPSDTGLTIPTYTEPEPVDPDVLEFDFVGPVNNGATQSLTLTSDFRVADISYNFVSEDPNTVMIDLRSNGVTIMRITPYPCMNLEDLGVRPWGTTQEWYAFLQSSVIPAGTLECEIVSSQQLLQEASITIRKSA